MLKLKGNKGITLIALIITIIVLLILAGVTISAINGNENTMGKAKIAKEENEIANELEAIKLAITDAMAKGLNGKVSDVHLRESIAGIIDDSELNNISGEGPWTIKTKLGKTYEINGYGQIEPAATPTDIYVTLDGDTLRFYAQKDNVSGTLVKEKNSDEPINLRGEGFTKSASDNPWYNNTNIKKVSFEEVVVPTSTMRWFVNCSGITNIENIERLNTRYVTNMNRMFYGCSGLTELDLSKFSTENVTDMRCMFYNCSNLITIYVGDKWNTDAVTQSEYMFSNCKNLTGGAGTIYSSSYIDKSRAKIDGGTSDPGYFTDIKIVGMPWEKATVATLNRMIGTNVSGYYAGEVSNWQLLYAEKNEVFLITKDILSPSEVGLENGIIPISIYETDNNKTDLEKLGFVFREDSYGKKYNSEWLGMPNANLSLSKHKAVAYLCDEKNWEQFVMKKEGTNEKLIVNSYAVGGPTQEIYTKAWNLIVSEEQKGTISVKDVYGYDRSINIQQIKPDVANGVFSPTRLSNNFFYIASPCWGGSSGLINCVQAIDCAACAEEIYGENFNSPRVGTGFRPIVSLPLDNIMVKGAKIKVAL